MRPPFYTLLAAAIALTVPAPALRAQRHSHAEHLDSSARVDSSRMSMHTKSDSMQMGGMPRMPGMAHDTVPHAMGRDTMPLMGDSTVTVVPRKGRRDMRRRREHGRHDRRGRMADSAQRGMQGMKGMEGMQGMNGMQGMQGMGGMMLERPLGISMERDGSGTSWLPDATPMYARHFMEGAWEFMLHGSAFVQYDKQGYGDDKRGDSQFGSVNWGMLMAGRNLGSGFLTLRGMMSLEAFTVTGAGYPLLLQTGESYQGQPLHDRQHPHDLFMELAAMYDQPLTSNLAFQLYVAPVGEPALGPVAFPHRPSAMDDPLAPLSHHWQDATHISFGVITAGLYTGHVKLEGSVFNGREPDEIRTNFDYKGRSLDSYAGRLTVNPSNNWSLQGSYGFIKSPEGLHPERSLHRVTASALNGRKIGSTGQWSSALIYGANKESDESSLSNSVVLESDAQLDRSNTFFGRLEFVQKSAGDLVLQDSGTPVYPFPPCTFCEASRFSDDTRFNIGAVALGYVREIGKFSGGTIGLGARGAINFVPEALSSTYGTRTPIGTSIFLRFRPNRMNIGQMGAMKNSGHMNHSMHMGPAGVTE